MAETAEGSIIVEEKQAAVEEQIADTAVPDFVSAEKETSDNQVVPSTDPDTAETITAEKVESIPETAAVKEDTIAPSVVEETDEASPQSSNKRKTDDDETCPDESKRPKTDDVTAVDQPTEEASVAETVAECKKDEQMETEASVDETSPAPVQDSPTEVAAEADVPEIVEDTKSEEKDSSENKENVIDEAITNGTAEKAAEITEEEPIKGSKTLDETEAPVDAEAISL